MSAYYYQCDICKEAFFLSTDARRRHRQICSAVRRFFDPTPDESHEPPPMDLSKQDIPTTQSAGRQSPPVDLSKDPAKQNDPATQASTSSALRTATKRKSAHKSDEKRRRLGALTYELKKALSSARDYLIPNPGTFSDLEPFLQEALLIVASEILQDELNGSTSFKYNVVLEAEYIHPEGPTETFNFKTRSKMLSSPEVDDLQETLRADMAKLLQEESESHMKGSGWHLVAPTSLTIRVSRFTYRQPSGSAHTVLPKKLENRKATINVANTDNKCFLYCILVKHLPNLHANVRLTEESFADVNTDRYDLTGIKFPVTINDIRRFERQNQNCSVNVFECGPEGDIIPIKVVDRELEDHTDLLLYKDSGESHYVLITDFAKLVRPQITKGRNKITICKRCSTYTQTRYCTPDAKTWLEEHMRLCTRYTPAQVRLPKEGKNYVKFESYETLIPVPIIIVADFEATLLPTASTNNTYQVHSPNSFCTLIKSTLPQETLEEVGISLTPHLYRSQDAGKEFLLHMKDLAQRIESLYLRQVPLVTLTDDERQRHDETTACDLCGQSFNEASCTKILDHCHITGRYRHCLCNRCNLRCQTPNFIPVYLHNLSNYDQAFIVKNLATLKGCEVKVIPSNTEKFISISVRIGKMWIRFLDSYRLMSDSLARLTDNLSASELVESSKLVPATNVDIIKRKGVYPYDYVTSLDVFKEEQLPPKDAFYNRLNDEHISDSDYEHAMNVWRVLDMKTFGDYHDFYLKLDTCLLADVLCSFRQKCIKYYRIDCAHQYTAPGMAFQSMMLMTKIKLELMTDPDQLLMVESATRGGLVQCCLKYFRANNPMLELPSDYNANEPSSYILYKDCTNLYGYTMSEHPLPTGDFKWIDTDNLDWTNLPADAPQGLILECDTEFPQSIHDKLQDLPPLAENQVPPGGKNKKLLATLTNKNKYVAHYLVFQQAIRMGVKITKVHRALQFSQSRWMSKFINCNADLRAQSTDEFSRAFFKLMNNSVFGKTMESVRNRVDIRIVTSDKAFQKLVRQAKFKEHRIISENVVAVQMRRNSIVMNKPVYVGMVVLDLSKVHMYKFHYEVLKEHFKYPECELELAYLDTDGGFWALKTELNINDIMKQPSFSKWMDGSVYPTGHPLKCDKNKGKIGTFKDETRGRSLLEYIGLRPKMYTYRYRSDEVKAIAKAKGIKSSYVVKHLLFDKYKETLFDKRVQEKAEYNLISCKSFNLTSKTVVKKSLSSEDDKRKVLSCGVKTLPYGHYRLQTIAEEDSSSDEQTV